ncbi:MAG: PilZ domain-containing protein [Phycisphaeraceae bacterium]
MAEEETANLHSLRRFLQRLADDDQEQMNRRGAEKRRHERHLFMVETRVRYVKRFDEVGSCPDEFVAYTKDISRSGISIIHEHELYPGEIVQVELKRGQAATTLLVRVIRCRRAGLKVFDIAGEFLTPDEAEAARLSIVRNGSGDDR